MQCAGSSRAFAYGIALTPISLLPHTTAASTDNTSVKSPTPVPLTKESLKTSGDTGNSLATCCVHKTNEGSDCGSSDPGIQQLQQLQMSTAPVSRADIGASPLSVASAGSTLEKCVCQEPTACASAVHLQLQSTTSTVSSHISAHASILASGSAAQQMQQSTLCKAPLSPLPVSTGSLSTITGPASTTSGSLSGIHGPSLTASEPLIPVAATTPSSDCCAVNGQILTSLGVSHSKAGNPSLNCSIFLAPPVTNHKATLHDRMCQQEAKDAQLAIGRTGNQTEIMPALQACQRSMSRLLGFSACIEPHACTSMFGQVGSAVHLA